MPFTGFLKHTMLIGCSLFIVLAWASGGLEAPAQDDVIPIKAPGPIIRPGVYRLENDVTIKKRGFRIQASDVVFDLNGKSITHKRHQGCRHPLITVPAGRNVEIFNGTLHGGQCGICMRQRDGVIQIHRIRFEHQRLASIFLREFNPEAKVFIENNHVSHAGYYGILLRRVHHASIRKNVIDSAGDYGIYLVYSRNVRVENNDVQVTNIGILVDNSMENHIANNRIHYSYYSIYLFKSFHNIVKENLLAFSNFGVFRYQSSNNRVENNKRM